MDMGRDIFWNEMGKSTEAGRFIMERGKHRKFWETYSLGSTFVDALGQILCFGGGVGALLERFRCVVTVHFSSFF